MSDRPQLLLRPAARGDDAALLALRRALIAAEHAAYADRPAIQAVLDASDAAARTEHEALTAIIEEAGGAFVVGEVEGVIVCSGCWYRSTAQDRTFAELRAQATIGAIAVHPDYRGHGFARLMMTHLEGLIAKEGLAHARLVVVPGNQPAERLYDSLGYESLETIMIKAL
jgi:ribosomal protein S18 acetylase RimI-like enzyme